MVSTLCSVLDTGSMVDVGTVELVVIASSVELIPSAEVLVNSISRIVVGGTASACVLVGDTA